MKRKKPRRPHVIRAHPRNANTMISAITPTIKSPKTFSQKRPPNPLSSSSRATSPSFRRNVDRASRPAPLGASPESGDPSPAASRLNDLRRDERHDHGEDDLDRLAPAELRLAARARSHVHGHLLEPQAGVRDPDQRLDL